MPYRPPPPESCPYRSTRKTARALPASQARHPQARHPAPHWSAPPEPRPWARLHPQRVREMARTSPVPQPQARQARSPQTPSRHPPAQRPGPPRSPAPGSHPHRRPSPWPVRETAGAPPLRPRTWHRRAARRSRPPERARLPVPPPYVRRAVPEGARVRLQPATGRRVNASRSCPRRAGPPPRNRRAPHPRKRQRRLEARASWTVGSVVGWAGSPARQGESRSAPGRPPCSPRFTVLRMSAVVPHSDGARSPLVHIRSGRMKDFRPRSGGPGPGGRPRAAGVPGGP